MLRTLPSQRWLVAGGLLLAGIAYSSPWDIDMIDSRALRAYEWKMRPAIPDGSLQRPEGAIARSGEIGTYQNDAIPAGGRDDAGTDAMKNPYPASERALADGVHLFEVTCAPCHGQGGVGGGPVTKNDPAAGIKRFPTPAPPLAGVGSAPGRLSDGKIYFTIRNGFNTMPAYGASLTDHERWAIVGYLRTLEGNTAPAAAAPAATTTGTPG